MSPLYNGLPEKYQGQVRLWLEEGKTPDSLIRSVIRNDLREAIARCDRDFALVGLLVHWFYQEAPQGSWGSDKCLSNWPMYLQAKKQQELEHGPEN